MMPESEKAGTLVEALRFLFPSPAAQRTARSLVLILMVSLLFLTGLSAVVIAVRALQGSAISIGPLEIGAASANVDVDVDADADADGGSELGHSKNAIDLEKISYHWLSVPVESSLTSECMVVLRNALNTVGFIAAAANSNGSRSYKTVGADKAMAALTCVHTRGGTTIFGYVLSENGALASEEGSRIFASATNYGEQMSTTFSPPDGVVPHFWVWSVNYPLSVLSETEMCAKTAENALRYLEFRNVTSSINLASADFADGKIVANCIRSYESQEYTISVSAFGHSSDGLEKEGRRVVKFLREQRDANISMLAETTEDIIIVEPDQTPGD
jgi:hypothetical protein